MKAKGFTFTKSSKSGAVKLFFHVVEDPNSENELVAFAQRLGVLDIDDKEGIIERYLVIHPDKSKNPPVEDPQGSTQTGTAQEEDDPI